MTSSIQWRHRFLLKLFFYFLGKFFLQQKLSTRELEKYINQILSSKPSKTTARDKNEVSVAMATRETAIAPLIFNREIKNLAQICAIVCTIILYQYFGFLFVQIKNNENHEFSQYLPEFIALSGKMNLTENNCKSPCHPFF